jgi:hypothetical protein
MLHGFFLAIRHGAAIPPSCLPATPYWVSFGEQRGVNSRERSRVSSSDPTASSRPFSARLKWKSDYHNTLLLNPNFVDLTV